MQLYKNFSFPLNVYAHILSKDYGAFDYLHYGLFEPDDDDVIKAQRRASELLFSRLPPCPCRILEVGIGLGTTLSTLVKSGYDVTGITPDADQINYAKSVHGADLPVFLRRLEDFSDARKFDLMLFQESAQYIHTTDLFNKALELLADDGQIIIMDEVTLRPSPTEPGLPARDTYLSMAEALGFELIEQLDLSSQMAPTNVYLVDAVTRYREDLIHDLDLSAEEIDGLMSAAQLQQAKYDDGRYGYCFLCFKKKHLSQ